MTETVIILGGGPAGVEAALAAAPHARVTLVTDGPVGDWSKLMPSRVLLTALERHREAEVPAEQEPPQFDLTAAVSRAREVAAGWSDRVRADLEACGVRVIEGRGVFSSPRQVVVSGAGGEESLQGDAIVIAAGSIPSFPPFLEPDGQRVFSPGTWERLLTLPRSILVIGDGPAGFETVDMFSKLGVGVTWIVIEGGPRSGWAAEADEVFMDAFNRRGVETRSGKPLVDLERQTDGVAAVKPDGSTLSADAAYVTIGYQPNLTPLQLERAGLETDDRGLLTPDGFGRTEVRHIYVVGDAVSHAPGNFAMAQAHIAARHACGLEVAPFDRSSTAVSFGVNPQVAQVGTMDSGDGSTQSARLSYDANLFAHVTGDTEGFIRLVWDGGGKDRRRPGCRKTSGGCAGPGCGGDRDGRPAW